MKTTHDKAQGADIQKINTLDEVNDALIEMARAEMEIEALNNRVHEAIRAIRTQALEKGRVLRTRITELSGILRQFSERNKVDLFNKERSLCLPAGVVGYQKSIKINVRKNTLRLMRKEGLSRYIAVKEAPNREAMRGLSDEELRKVDALRVEQDLFFCETNHKEASAVLMKRGNETEL